MPISVPRAIPDPEVVKSASDKRDRLAQAAALAAEAISLVEQAHPVSWAVLHLVHGQELLLAEIAALSSPEQHPLASSPLPPPPVE